MKKKWKYWIGALIFHVLIITCFVLYSNSKPLILEDSNFSSNEGNLLVPTETSLATYPNICPIHKTKLVRSIQTEYINSDYKIVTHAKFTEVDICSKCKESEMAIWEKEKEKWEIQKRKLMSNKALEHDSP